MLADRWRTLPDKLKQKFVEEAEGLRRAEREEKERRGREAEEAERREREAEEGRMTLGEGDSDGLEG